MFTMMNRVLGTNTNKSNRNKNRLHEIKNGNSLCKTPNTRPPKLSPNKQRLQKISRFLNILKNAGITFLPNEPHQSRHKTEDVADIFNQIASLLEKF